jgi:hypothetical protein
MFDITTLIITAILVSLLGLVFFRRRSKDVARQRRVAEIQANIRKRKQSEERAEMHQLLDAWSSSGGSDNKHIAKV